MFQCALSPNVLDASEYFQDPSVIRITFILNNSMNLQQSIFVLIMFTLNSF